jgi:bifunctional non-homologous end joining protein LigD
MRPMLATPGEPPDGDQWVHEVKWDGMRVLADVRDGAVRLTSRTGRDVTSGFPDLATAPSGPADALIDGEIIALSGGVPSFAALAERMQVSNRNRAARLAVEVPVTVMAFDLLRLYGVDLLARPHTERRASLNRVDLPGPQWQRSPLYPDGRALFAATAEQGLEGVVSKRSSSRYQPGRRSPDWIKAAHRRHQACVVGGWRPENARDHGDSPNAIGALLLGVPDPGDGLVFCGRVGSGLAGRVGRDLLGELRPLARVTSPFAEPLPRADAALARWCEPEVVVEVDHLGWTAGNRLRQPVFRGVRRDQIVEDVRRER